MRFIELFFDFLGTETRFIYPAKSGSFQGSGNFKAAHGISHPYRLESTRGFILSSLCGINFICLTVSVSI